MVGSVLSKCDGDEQLDRVQERFMRENDARKLTRKISKIMNDRVSQLFKPSCSDDFELDLNIESTSKYDQNSVRKSKPSISMQCTVLQDINE